MASGLLCLLVADRQSATAILRDVTGAGAVAETQARADIGATITVRHPQAGTIEAEILGIDRTGLRLGFDRGEAAIGFALATVACRFLTPNPRSSASADNPAPIAAR